MNPDNLIEYIDLTNLEQNLSLEDINALCVQATSQPTAVAAVCVHNQFVKQCKAALQESSVKVASVFNFPFGDCDIDSVKEAINSSIDNGLDEIDIVIPLTKISKSTSHDAVKEAIIEFVSEIKDISDSHVSKFIISTDVLRDRELIDAVSSAIIDGGGDFIKTCTGKTGPGFDMFSLNVILDVRTRKNSNIGIKVSGGIKTMELACNIYSSIEDNYFPQKVTASNFRIGSSSLLKQIIASI